MYTNTLCPLCHLHEDTQKHVLECSITAKFISDEVIYEDIYSENIDTMNRIAKVFSLLLHIRENILKKLAESPCTGSPCAV